MTDADPHAIHQAHIRRTFALADDARQRGNHPFGAVLVVRGVEVATGENSVVTDRDPTAHAEMNLFRAIAGKFDASDLAGAVVYASTEPCAMCAAALYWSGIRTLVYGCSTERLAALAGGSLVVPCRQIFAQAAEPVAVVGPLLEDEAARSHAGFWR